MNKFFPMMIALAITACATTNPMPFHSMMTAPPMATTATNDQTAEIARLNEQNLCLQEYIACTTRGGRDCPNTCAEAAARQRREQQTQANATPVTASPTQATAQAFPAMPPLCPGVDSMFGSIPPWAQIPTSAMGFSNGAPMPTNASTNTLLVTAEPGFYYSVEINGGVMSQFAGVTGYPTMIVVRHPQTRQFCRMPAMGGERSVVRFLPDSYDNAQEMTIHAWYAPTDATGVPRAGTHLSRTCRYDPRWQFSSAGIDRNGCGT